MASKQMYTFSVKKNIFALSISLASFYLFHLCAKKLILKDKTKKCTKVLVSQNMLRCTLRNLFNSFV
jgi:hypothetical protein